MKAKYQARAFCLSCDRKVVIEDATQCGSRISGTCNFCDRKVSTLRIKECTDPKPYTKKVKTRAMLKKAEAKATKKQIARMREYDWV